jgi:hypothetical protein
MPRLSEHKQLYSPMRKDDGSKLEIDRSPWKEKNFARTVQVSSFFAALHRQDPRVFECMNVSKGVQK